MGRKSLYPVIVKCWAWGYMHSFQTCGTACASGCSATTSHSAVTQLVTA